MSNAHVYRVRRKVAMGGGDEDDRTWVEANPVSDHEADLIFRRAMRGAQRLRLRNIGGLLGKPFSVDIKEPLENLQSDCEQAKVAARQAYVLLSLKADIKIILEAIDRREMNAWFASRQ